MKTQSSTPTNRRPFLATWARILLILALVLSQAFIGAVPVAHAAAAWTAHDYNNIGTNEPGANTTTAKMSGASSIMAPAADTCGTFKGGVGADDADEVTSTGAMDLDGTTTGNYLIMYRCYGSGCTTNYLLNWWGLRFLNVNVPKGATITSATLTFRPAGTNSSTTASSMTFWGQKTISPGIFTTTAYNISSRTKTTASATWSVPVWTNGTDSTFSDLAPVVQELVNQSGWVANQAMVIVGQNTVAQTRSALSYESTNGTTYGPRLYICYNLAVPTITTSGTLSAFNSAVGTPSAQQSYTVAGTNLTAPIVITPPTDFELSLTSGSGFSSSPISLSPSSGTVTSTSIYVRLNPSSATTYSANITHTSTGATQKDVAVSGSSVPTIITTSSMTAFSAAVGVYSAEKSYTVSAVNLTTDLVIAPPADFEVSLTSGSAFVANPGTLTVSPGAYGAISSVTIYTRFKKDTAGTDTNVLITHDSTGATQKTVTVSGTAIDPTITTTGTLSAFSSVISVPSAEQSYTVAGTYLAGNVTVTAPTGFQISTTSGSGFGSTLSLSPTNGTLASTTIYVRLYSATVGSYSGNITHASSGATTKNVAASGTVSLCADVSLVVSADTHMRSGSSRATYNYGGSTTVRVNPYYLQGGTDDQLTGALFKWVLTSVPSAATVETASMTFYVEDSSTYAYSLYNMRQAWVEGTNNGTAGTGASWNFYGAGTGSWGTTGAQNTSSDRYDTNLWDAAAADFGTAGSKTFTLNAAGIAAVQGWVTTPGSNNGVTLQNYSGTSTDLWVVTSSEGTTVANRPKLNLHYCMPNPNPTITVNGTLSSFSTPVGTPSAAQTYTVSGSNLTEDILIAAPTGFEISTDGSNYYATRTLTQSGGSVSTTTIYVRLTGASVGTFSGNIAHTSSGATEVDLAASGTVAVYYTLTAGNDGNGTVTLSPTGGYYASGTTVTLTPVPNTGYKFSDWSGTNALDIVNTGGVYTIVMNGDKTVSANFAAKAQYTLNTAISPEGTGSITLDPATGPYYEGDVVTLTAVPGSGYAFSSWTGHLSGSTNPTTLTMNGDKFVTAIFTAAQTCNTVNLEAAQDTYMSGYNTDYNYGGVNLFKVTNNNAGTNRGALLKWDVSSIPSAATVSSASLTLYVSTASSQAYNLYNMRRSWVEGTTTPGATSTTSATWETYDGTNAWGTNGAANTSSDRYDNNLWSTTTSTFTPVGSKTISLNTDGKGVVQGWIAGTLSNYGLTMQSYSSTSGSDDLQISSSENTTTANRPKLNVTYCTGGTATYTLTMSNDGHGTVTLNPAGPTYTAGTVVTLTPAPASGYEFATWTGTNAEDPSDNGNGTWSLIMDGNKSITANFSLIPVNVAPNQPVLVQPTDNATGISLPPTLEVTVSDANTADTLDVNFYGRPVGTTAGDDFTLVLVPDPQNLTQYYPTILTSQFSWIASHATSNNIVFVTTTGDLVNTSTDTAQYTTIDGAFDLVDAAGIPYSVGPGNHDYALTNYNVYFGTSRFSGKSWYKGYTGTGNENNYSFFSAAGNDFILINLGYNPSATYMNWADALLKANPTKRGIVVSHSILNIDNSWTYQALYTSLKDNPNLFLMLCGHMHSSTDGSAYRAEPGDDGHTIHIMQADYQDINNGYLRILRFSPAADKIYGTTYSPYTGGSLTSTTNYDQAELAYDLASGSAAAYTLIGAVNDVTNGGNASIAWNDLTNATEYEWYATVSDGTETVTGPTWSFTTGTGNSAPTDISLSNSSVAENQSANTTVGALSTTDPDTGNTFTYSLVSGAGDTDNASFNISGDSLRTFAVFDYETKNSYAIRVRTTDQGGLYTEKTFTVAVSDVNDAPVLGAIGSRSVNELVLLTFTATAIDADLPANTLTFSLANGTSGTVPAGAAIDGISGVFTWTPTEAQGPGNYAFDVCVSDGTASDCETISVTVSEVNVAPEITEGDSVNVTMTKNGDPTPFSLLLHATDADGGDTLTWSISTAAGQGTASASGTGLTKDIGYTPGTDYVGSDSFVVQVSDGNGGTDTITVNVTILDAHSISIALVAGWNLVSFNVHPVDTDIADVLASISGNYDLVYAWVDGAWQHYDPAQGFGNTLGSLDESMGFWVEMTTPDTLIVTGTAPSTSGIALKAGWNLVSFPGATSQTLPEAFINNDVDLTNLNLVMAMHADRPADPWLLYDKTAPAYVNDLTELTPGWGYWISVVSDDTWTVP